MSDTAAGAGSVTTTRLAAGLLGFTHAALRVGTGLLFFMHGAPKLFAGWGAGPFTLDAWRTRR